MRPNIQYHHPIRCVDFILQMQLKMILWVTAPPLSFKVKLCFLYISTHAKNKIVNML